MHRLLIHCFCMFVFVQGLYADASLKSDETWRKLVTKEAFDGFGSPEMGLGLSYKVVVQQQPESAGVMIAFDLLNENEARPIIYSGSASFSVVMEDGRVSIEPGAGSIGFSSGSLHGAVAVVVKKATPRTVTTEVYLEIGRGKLSRASHPSNFFEVDDRFTQRRSLWQGVSPTDQILSRKLFERTFWID